MARKRARRCHRKPQKAGRCRFHGGTTKSGKAHHNYKHGFYSKTHRGILASAGDAYEALEVIATSHDELAVHKALILHKLEEIHVAGPSDEAWLELRASMLAVDRMRKDNDRAGMLTELNKQRDMVLNQASVRPREWGPQRRPDLRYINSSYASHLSIRDNVKSRTILQSGWFQAQWGHDGKCLNETRITFPLNLRTAHMTGSPVSARRSACVAQQPAHWCLGPILPLCAALRPAGRFGVLGVVQVDALPSRGRPGGRLSDLEFAVSFHYRCAA